jgi:hypothetical protein
VDYLIIVNKENPKYSTTFSQVKTEIQGVLDKQIDDRLASDWQLFAEYQGNEAWSACQQMVSQSMLEGYSDPITIKSDDCPVPPPRLTGNQQRETDYCKCLGKEAAKTDKWCSNPCCNHELEKHQCCAPQDVEVGGD